MVRLSAEAGTVIQNSMSFPVGKKPSDELRRLVLHLHPSLLVNGEPGQVRPDSMQSQGVLEIGRRLHMESMLFEPPDHQLCLDFQGVDAHRQGSDSVVGLTKPQRFIEAEV